MSCPWLRSRSRNPPRPLACRCPRVRTQHPPNGPGSRLAPRTYAPLQDWLVVGNHAYFHVKKLALAPIGYYF